MNSPQPTGVSLDDVVAKLINLHFVPVGFTVLEMTAAYVEMAEVNYDNGCAERLSAGEITKLKLVRDACRARHDLAEMLHAAVCSEIEFAGESQLQRSDAAGVLPQVTTTSAADWAFESFGIDVSEWSTKTTGSPTNAKTLGNWEDVTIKIYADYKLGVRIGNGKFKQHGFVDIGLLGKRKLEPNELGGLLIGLAVGQKYPPSPKCEGKHKTLISNLRRALRKVADFESDPFFPFNEGDGWKPRFTLIDDRRNAAEREKMKAIHVPLEEAEARDYDDEDDDAAAFLREHGH